MMRPPPRAHRPQEGPSDHERGEQENLDLVADLLDGHLLRSAHDRVSGVVDHDVHRRRSEHPAEHFVDLDRSREVENVDGQLASVRLAQIRESRRAANRRRDPVTVPECVFGEMATEAAGGR